MKKHKGMRPQDVAILLKIAAKGKQPWMMKDLARELEISASEVSESLNRSVLAGLIKSDKKQLMRLALQEFLVHGLRYVFPQVPGELVRGMPTAHSASPLKEEIVGGGDVYVWPFAQGKDRGQAIAPLYPKLPHACQKDQTFYELMALVDSFRVGKARERKIAERLLNERLC